MTMSMTRPTPRHRGLSTPVLVLTLALVIVAPTTGAATTHHRRAAGHTAAKSDTSAATAPGKAAAAKTDTGAVNAPVIPLTGEPLATTLATVKALYAAHAAVFVDARTAEEYAAGHIAGAISLPFDDAFKSPELAKRLADHGLPMVTYCGGGDCPLSKDLAFTLIDQGHTRVLYYVDGYPGWQKAGGATRTGAKP